MKILYLTFYFEPDLCAGSFRNTPLAYELARQSSTKGGTVKVITTQPNRYSSYNKKAEAVEYRNNLIIRRIDVTKHKSGFYDQIWSFRSYFKGVLREIKNDSFDLVFASSSRLFTAYLGYKIAKKRQIPLYLDIRDLFIDTMKEVFKIPVIKKPVLLYLKYIEKKVFGYASHINFISGGFNAYADNYNINCITNFSHGIDKKYINTESSESVARGYYVITYAGNIGDGQGLHKIIPDAALQLGEKYNFRIIGDGGQLNKLKELIKARNINNVTLEKPVSREELFDIYSDTDFFFIHLNDYKAFNKVLPSKVFELGASNKPIIAGVSGFSKDFMETHLDNVILFKPGNVEELVSKLKSYKYKTSNRSDFIRKFSRERINREMAASILSCRNYQQTGTAK
ncbi:MAG: glycosyltransferase family 4 protein [bacterium]